MTRYGDFDSSKFSELELRMYVLIQSNLASKMELEEYYTLDEALKLYALHQMSEDIKRIQLEDIDEERRMG